nr:TIGR00730 family Rossman fold protein [uncultured Celeribacter sp.]
MTFSASSASFSVCVYCGSRPGADPAYMQAATEFGTAIADNGWRLVYGAGDVGLMGAVARAAHDNGAETFGVIPTHLLGKEKGKRDLTTFVITENMHERKKVMFMNSDAIVVLPGGAGSLDEFFEVLTWKQIGLHEKPIFLLSTDGYWTPLRSLIDHIVAQGFATGETAGYFETVETVPELVAALRARRA